MNQRLLHQLQLHGAHFETTRFLIAVSGGLDSMVLAASMHELGAKLLIAHVNYGLRGAESEADEVFVADWAQKNKVPFLVKKVSTLDIQKEQGGSIQELARTIRYDWFSALLQSQDCHFLLTAHHLNDALETSIHHFVRGSGVQGLLGIQSKAHCLRPLIQYTRAELFQWAHQKGWQWRDDSSNAKSDYTRNRIRHEVIPLLKSFNPSLEQSFDHSRQQWKHTYDLAQYAATFLWEQCTSQHKDGLHIDLEILTKVPGFEHILYQQLQQFGFAQWDEIYRMPQLETGKKVLSATHVLIKQPSILVLLERVLDLKGTQYALNVPAEMTVPINISLKYETDISPPQKNSIVIDWQLLTESLVLRQPLPNDYIYPTGMEGRKSLGKYFKDAQIPVYQRPHTWVLAHGHEIIWIIGSRANRRFLATDNSQQRVEICWFEG